MRTSYSNTVGNKFYQKIGNLFFAISMADGSVHTKEIDKLKAMVREKWIPLDDIEDEYGTDSAFQIEIVFDWLLENEKTGSECFKEFNDFYQEHKTIFTDKIKKLIIETSASIASSFAGKNKSELMMLGKLQLLFYPE
ncbi:hypothetical protein [uncultured Croceitalea sp.]|uniref:hypothetical protein n=1 Tax=uncultured Croceitalea sp. TaxID=1798908 RepID=UPI00374FBE2F